MPDPEGGEVSDELLEKIGIAHSDNPASRSVEPLERFLDECGDLSYVEMYGILQAAMEGPLVIRASSIRMLVSVLRYIGRNCGSVVLVLCLVVGARNIFLI